MLLAWLHSVMAKPVFAPLTSKLENRSALLTIAIVWQFCLESTERFRKRDVTGDGRPETFCNFWAVAFAWAMGTPIPQLRANQLFEWFQSDEAKQQGWELVNEHVAQAMADTGQVAFAVWRNPEVTADGWEKPGHIAPIMPSLGETGTFLANVGASNFSRGRIATAFGDKLPAVLFFAHP